MNGSDVNEAKTLEAEAEAEAGDFGLEAEAGYFGLEAGRPGPDSRPRLSHKIKYNICSIT